MVTKLSYSFQATASGLYDIGIYVGTTVAVSTYFYIYKNGSKYKTIMSITGTSNSTGAGLTTIRLNGNDTVEIRPGSSVTIGGAALNADASHIDIKRVGN